MSDTYVPSFFSDDPRTGALTYPQLEARRRIAMALATRNRPYPKTVGEGLTALGEGIGEGYVNRNLERAEVEQQSRDTKARGGMYAPTEPAVPAAPAAPASPAPVSEAAPSDGTQALALATDGTAQPSQMSIEEWKQRVARNESGLRKDAYTLVGERSRRGDYPYGKFQVMGENVPKWTKQFVGREMTPDEFLKDPDAQETVASGQGGKYLAQYGPEGAAAAWFAGPNGMNDPNRKDTLGTHVAEYRRRFNLPLVSRNQVAASVSGAPMSDEAGMAMAYAPEGAGEPSQPPVQLASLGGGVPTPDPAPGRDAVAAAVAAQGGAVPPQQVAAGPAPIPQAPPALPPGTPTVTPQALPKAPAQQAQPVEPGAEPKLENIINGPKIKPYLDAARKTANDNTLSPTLRAEAVDRMKELRGLAQDEHTKQWTVWHGRQQIQEKFKLEEEDKNLQTAKLRGEAEDAAETRVLKQRLGGQEPQKFFDNFAKEQSSADLAGKIRDDNRIILKAVRDGVVMGAGAGWRVQADKLASWAFQNGYASEQAANTEILRALGGSRIREALSQVNPVGVASNTDLLLARQLSGAEPSMEPKAFMALLHKSSEHNAKLLNDYEDKKDYYLAGTRAERQFNLNTPNTAPVAMTDKMLANRDDKALRAEYDNTYGEGSSALEIERFKRRQRRGGG